MAAGGNETESRPLKSCNLGEREKNKADEKNRLLYTTITVTGSILPKPAGIRAIGYPP